MSARVVPCEVQATKRRIDVTCFISFSESKRKVAHNECWTCR
jgi:hypothetical protein